MKDTIILVASTRDTKILMAIILQGFSSSKNQILNYKITYISEIRKYELDLPEFMFMISKG